MHPATGLRRTAFAALPLGHAGVPGHEGEGGARRLHHRHYARIGVLQLLAAAGLGIGLAVPVIGVLAASQLLLLLVGALVSHLRAGDSPSELIPAGIVAVLTVASLVAPTLTG